MPWGEGAAIRFHAAKRHPKADGSWMVMNGHHGQRVLVDQGTQTVLVQTAVDHDGPWQDQFFKLFAAACRAV